MATTDAAALAVLLIEDNPGDARLIELMLREVSETAVRLARADRLATGIECLGLSHVDAVLLDLSLPDSQGLGTFARLHEAMPDVPVVVLSGLSDETVAVQAVAAGAQDYLVKGHVDGVTLLRALRYAVERQRAELERRHLLAREQIARAQAERLASERAAILGQIADAVLIADPEGCVTFANVAAQHLFGRSALAHATAACELPWPLHDTHGAPLPPDEHPLSRAARRGAASVEEEWTIPRPGGATTIVQGSAVPVLADDGTRLGAVLTLRDVTAQRDLERQKEEFFANASHDLRTPLMAIKAAIGVVIANVPPATPAPLRRMFGNIDNAADEMARMVEDLLELARLRAGRTLVSPLLRDLREVAERAARTIEPLVAERGQRLALDLPDEPVWALVDPPRLERVVQNLLGNAQKFGHTGGTIALSVRREGGEAILAVADDGPGIAPEDLDRIFERYYRPAHGDGRRSPGSGLGLPIVRALVELHGGRVWVESEAGHGSTFSVAVPLAPATDGPWFEVRENEGGRAARTPIAAPQEVSR
jgi:signal transduction histidine kinase